ncbi:mitochondrial Homoaconitase [Schaereria dolodes]|nr:mitochondrial Homoaconitase [Schaereria dolodes]
MQRVYGLRARLGGRLSDVLPEGVTGKGDIVALCGLFNQDEVLNYAIESNEPEETMKSIPVDDPMAIAKMTTEWGALARLRPIDTYISDPDSVKIAAPLDELSVQDIKIDKAYLVSCTNSSASDVAAAAKVFKDVAKENQGKILRIAAGVNFNIATASMLEQLAAEEAGD